MSLRLSVVPTGKTIGAVHFLPALTVYLEPSFATEAGKPEAQAGHG